MSKLWEDAKKPVFIDALWNSLCFHLRFGKILHVQGHRAKLMCFREAEPFCGQRKRFIAMVAWGRFNGYFPPFVPGFPSPSSLPSPPPFLLLVSEKNASKTKTDLGLSLGVWRCEIPDSYGIHWFMKRYKMLVVFLPFQLLIGCLPLPLGIAKSSGVRNPFSAIKCKREKSCINLCKVTDWTYVFKLFWTSLQIISICAQSFCDIMPQRSKIN